MPPTDEHSARRGLWYGIAAYGLWGLIPLYFKAIGPDVPPAEVLAHRIVWSALLLGVLTVVLRRGPALMAALKNRRVWALLGISSVLIGVNWLTYIYTVAAGHVLQASLGYFITPLVNVLLGVVFLHERLRPKQLAGIALAVIGVAILTVAGGEFPWISLTLALTFAFYGLIRKTVPVDAMLGLLIETLLLLGPAAACLVWFHARGEYSFGQLGPTIDLLLCVSGVVTMVPLLSFAAAARRLRMSTLGVLQYLAPTVQFLLAVLAFGEEFSQAKFVSFCFIWTAVAIYTYDSLHTYHRRRRAPAAVPATPSPETVTVDRTQLVAGR